MAHTIIIATISIGGWLALMVLLVCSASVWQASDPEEVEARDAELIRELEFLEGPRTSVPLVPMIEQEPRVYH
jgi:hypothetical protein